MNTIKIQPYSQPSMDTHKVEEYSFFDSHIKGHSLKIYSHIPLHLYITGQCNGKCPFCMNVYEKNFKNCIEYEEDSAYLFRLEKILKLLLPIKPPLIITGGEPTLSTRLEPVLRMATSLGYQIRSFSTNGFNLKNYLPLLKELKIDKNISISRMAIDERVNSTLVGCNSFPRIETLKEIFDYGKVNDLNIRLSCVLQKYGIKDLMQIMDFYDSLDFADNVIFREMISVENNDWYNKNRVSINNIISSIEKNSDFILENTINGYYYTVYLYKYKDLLYRIYIEKDSIDKSVSRELIFYPDGKLVDTTWNDTSRILIGADEFV